MKKRIMVTGGCGYIGSHTAVALIENNFEALIFDDLSISNKDLSIISLRYFNPIGAHDSGQLGELPNGIPNNFMS